MKWISFLLTCILAIAIALIDKPLKAAFSKVTSPHLNPTDTTISNKSATTSGLTSAASASPPTLLPNPQPTTTPPNMTATAPAKLIPRLIRTTLLAREQSEGVGAVVRRSIGTPKLRHLTPFLMLDHFSVSPGAGFPDHPHRGQETITYLLSGGVDHEDFAGNKGTIGPGDLQFMTAGRGIMHAEMPRQDVGVNTGMQLWVDLPEKLKSVEPRYRDLRAGEIPTVDVDEGRVHVKVISGRSHGVDSVRDLAYTPVWILDVTVKPGGRITQELPRGWNAFAYTLSGVVNFSNGPAEGAEGPEGTEGIAEAAEADSKGSTDSKGSATSPQQAVPPYHNVIFEPSGDVVSASVEDGSSESARFMLIAGQPLDQEIVQYGPFVQTTKEGVYQAMMDFQTNSNGFERALNWRSEIGRSMAH